MYEIIKENNDENSDIQVDEDDTIIGLSTPIEEPPVTQAYPPTHHHGETIEYNSVKENSKPEIFKQIPGNFTISSEKGADFLDYQLILSGETSVSPHKDTENEIYEVHLPQEDSNKSPIIIDEKTGDQVSILPNEEEPTEAEIKSETFSTPDTHNFDFTLESEPQVNYNNDWNNTSTEGLPDTEVHDVKMAMGHLHFGNKTYDYFDPSLPHDESVHEQNHSKVAYVVIGVFAILFIIALVWSIRKIYSCMVSSEEYSKFLDDRSGRSDSISSQGRYNNDPKLQEIRRRELQKLDDELKGELDPVQFYKKQVEGSTKQEESKREVKKLNLDFHSQEEDSLRVNSE